MKRVTIKKKCKLIIAIAGLLLTGCFGAEAEREKIAVVANEEMPEYKVEQVRLVNIQSLATLYFSYEQSETTVYCFEKEGQIGTIYVKKGDYVNAGDLLACLDGYEQAKNDYETYTQQRESKQDTLETKITNRDYALREYEIKHKYGFMPDDEYKEKTDLIHEEYDKDIRGLEDEIAIIDLRIEEAKSIYEGGAIYASKSGKVTDVRNVYKSNNNNNNNDWWNWWEGGENNNANDSNDWVTRMNHVNTYDSIVAVADAGEAVFACETEYADKFSIGQKVELTYNSNQYSTKVSKIENNKITLTPYTVDDSMYVGMQVPYSLVTEEKEAVKAISKSSLHVSGEEYYVYIVGEDNLRQMRKVTVGISNTQDIEIVSGLETGELVVKR